MKIKNTLVFLSLFAGMLMVSVLDTGCKKEADTPPAEPSGYTSLTDFFNKNATILIHIFFFIYQSFYYPNLILIVIQNVTLN